MKRGRIWNFLDRLELKQLGAVVVVVLGLAIVMVITLFGVPKVPDADKATLVSGAFILIGTLVGAYTGVRVGSRGMEEAQANSQAAHKDLAAAMNEKAILTGELVAAIPEPRAAREALDRAEEKIARRAIDSKSATRAVFDAWFGARAPTRPDHPAYHDFATWIGEIAPQLPLPSYDEFEAWYREAVAKRLPPPGGAPERVGDA